MRGDEGPHSRHVPVLARLEQVAEGVAGRQGDGLLRRQGSPGGCGHVRPVAAGHITELTSCHTGTGWLLLLLAWPSPGHCTTSPGLYTGITPHQYSLTLTGSWLFAVYKIFHSSVYFYPLKFDIKFLKNIYLPWLLLSLLAVLLTLAWPSPAAGCAVAV